MTYDDARDERGSAPDDRDPLEVVGLVAAGITLFTGALLLFRPSTVLAVLALVALVITIWVERRLDRRFRGED